MLFARPIPRTEARAARYVPAVLLAGNLDNPTRGPGLSSRSGGESPFGAARG